MAEDRELAACTPDPIAIHDFNPNAEFPFYLKVQQICNAMQDFLDFMSTVNTHLHERNYKRLESFLMQANFSSMVGEFIKNSLGIHCENLVVNQYHNGHPDLIPVGRFPDDSVQHSEEGIEIKASRYDRGWQGHNRENCWLMVFVFDVNSPRDTEPRSFCFKQVLGAQLVEDDWSYSGRKGNSRRTITASVKQSGYEKMIANWIYKNPKVE